MEIPAIFYVSVMAATLILGAICLYFAVTKYGEDFFRAEQMVLFSLPLSLIIGRISYVALNFEEFRGKLSDVFLFWQGGATLFVTLIAFFVLVFCYSEVHALKAMLWLDIFIAPMIFMASLHELFLYSLFETASEFFASNVRAVTITTIGFTEREFLQLPALVEGVLTLVLSIVLFRIKKYDTGAVFFLGVGAFLLIRFVTAFFYIVSTPFVSSYSHIVLGIISLLFMGLFLFTIKTQARSV